MTTVIPSQTIREALPSSLEILQKQLESKTPRLARDGDADLANAALQVVKDIFDLGLEYEKLSHPHVQPFIISTLEPPTIDTRSKSKSKGKGKANGIGVEEEERIDPNAVLPYTPLSSLTLEGMDNEQIWAQLELRNEPMVKIVKQVGPIDMEPGTDEEEGTTDEEDELDSNDSMEDMTEEEFREMMLRGDLGDSDDGEDEEDEEDDDEEDGSDDEVAFYDDAEMDEEEEEEEEDAEFAPRLGSDDDDELELEDQDLENLEDEDEEEDEEEEGGEEDDEDDEDDAEEDEGEEDDEHSGGEIVDDNEDGDDRSLLFDDDDEPGPSQGRSKRRHPTLDDEFFSIDQFNRETEEAEAGRVSSGRLGGDEDEEDLEEDIGGLLLGGGDGADRDLMYSDFFAPPRGSASANGKAPVKGKKPDPKGKGKGKQSVRFDSADDAVESDEALDEDGEGGRDVMGRLKGDLFDDDDEAEDGESSKDLSTHEKHQLALAKQIAELEKEAVGPKDWTLLGEATSRSRPENSLLEEDLDFEQVAKVTPVVTEETVKTLEEIIRKRIIDKLKKLQNNFDSPVRVRAYEPTPFLPSRYFELQDTQSSKSLAQIYEDEYQAAAAGGKAKDPRDEKLRKEHEAIDKLWEDICYKLDALSSLNFVPKQPKAQITTVDNLPTTSLESALPPTSSATTLLAPEELFAAPAASASVARSEQTPEQAQAARTKRRKVKQGERRRLDEMAELYGKKTKTGKSGVRQEKEQALKGLVKTGKGVTVVGKGPTAGGDRGKKRPRGDEPRAEDGKKLKL